MLITERPNVKFEFPETVPMVKVFQALEHAKAHTHDEFDCFVCHALDALKASL